LADGYVEAWACAFNEVPRDTPHLHRERRCDVARTVSRRRVAEQVRLGR
jgi:hypothetical protein